MRLKEVIWQNRRDFSGIYECEKCGHSKKMSGYDDNNFHQNVSPNWKCEKCGKSTNSLGLKAVSVKTKYEPWEVV